MALENLQSQYGPFNKRGKIGTGENADPLAGEGKKNAGHAGNKSKFASTEKLGTPEKQMDGLAKGK